MTESVELAWQRMIKRCSEWTDERYEKWVAVVVLEAAAHPELRALYPYTSLHSLCFGRTPYPWSDDLPRIWAKDGQYSVDARQVDEDLGELLFTDDPEAAVQAVVDYLPARS